KAKELSDKVTDTLYSLYEHYASQKTCVEPTPSETIDLTTMEVESFEEWHDKIQMEFERDVSGKRRVKRKSDLDKYLDEERDLYSGKNFDILGWWKKRQESYPTLAIMVKDVLAIPVSTVASESAFSTGGRVLDFFRSSLSPKMVEALVCAQDWMRVSRGPLVLEETLEDVEKIEEGNIFTL
ncbi:putative AC transposase, partial [Bienertia sinuspersici]